MRWPRMTTRRWMMAVAIIALILTVGLCFKRRAAFLERAEHNARESWLFDERKPRYVNGKRFLHERFFEADGTLKEHFARLFERYRKHHAALEQKYRYAAAHPWLGVEPDPPEPQ